MEKRPLDFFGPEDYMGGDVLGDELRVAKAQEEWDARYASLPLWRRAILALTNTI